MLKPVSLVLALIIAASTLMIAQSNPGSAPQQTKQAPPAAQPIRPTQNKQAITGKTGNSSHSLDTTTTSSVGVETPGVQTDNGMVQQPDKYPWIKPVNPEFRSRPGAPPNWEQVGQDEQLANSNAAAAARAELGGPEGTLGVRNALPSYASGGKPTASSQTKTNQALPGQTGRNASANPSSTVKKSAPPQ